MARERLDMDEVQTWIRQIKTGSKAAANDLVATYYREVYAFVYKQTLSQELSLDMTQEIMISMLRSIRHYDSEKGAFRTWLYKIATARLVDYYRSKYYGYHRVVVPIEEHELVSTDDFTVTAEHREDVERILVIINRLDAATQQIFRLRFFAEESFREIAKALQMPEGTVKTKYYAMIRTIQKRFEEERHG